MGGFSRKYFVRQHDAMECGMACLTMIARYAGLKVDLPQLSEYASVSPQGVSLKCIVETAARLGMDSQGARATLQQLRDNPVPCILHWNQNHFVVLYKIKGRKYYLADPGKGMLCVNEDFFIKHWLVGEKPDPEHSRGIVLYLAPGKDFGEIEIGGEVAKRSFGFLVGYIKKYHRYMAQVLAGLMLGCVLQLIMPFLTQGLVDVGIRGRNISFIWLILLGELMIVVGRTATDFIRRWLLLHISVRINVSLVSDFFVKLLRLPMSFFDSKLIGDLLQRMGDHSRVQSFLTGQVLGIIFTFMSFIVYGVVLLFYDKVVFGVFLVGSLVYGCWIVTFLRRREMLDYELFEQQAINQSKTFQLITNMQEIKLQGCERRRRWKWEDVQADLFAVQMKSLKLQQLQEAGSIFINEIKNIFITVLAATAVIKGEITLGAMLAVQYIVGQLNSPVEQLMSFIYAMQDVKISLERINGIHTRRDEDEGRDSEKSFLTEDRSILLRNLNFKYNPYAPENTLSDISFTVPQGKVTAIVGASGSGKTTLIKLMLGYYPVETGSLRVGGRDLGEYSQKWWRRHCGVVMQEGVIFSESIARNIAMGDDEPDEERIYEAARVANAHEFIMELPLRYDTKIGPDGMGLSQGQKQRILIARAVYKNPDYIFLDEATNSLDALNERAIVENLGQFYNGRTVVVVAHRLSTVRNAAKIIVIDKGHVVEQGTHAELVAARGAYYNLVKNQLELDC